MTPTTTKNTEIWRDRVIRLQHTATLTAGLCDLELQIQQTHPQTTVRTSTSTLLNVMHPVCDQY